MTRKCKHTPCPKGYMAKCDWAHRMSKTHKQVKCPHCGLYAVWVPKTKRPERLDEDNGLMHNLREEVGD